MIKFVSFIQHHRKETLIFGFGVLLAILVAVMPRFDAVVRDGINRFGYFGILIAGALYSGSLTSATATLVLVQSSPTLNPVLVGLIGGVGAMLYDAVFFLIARREARRGWLAHSLERVNEHRRIPNWVSLMIGGAILASPFPDELAAGLLGVTTRRLAPFLCLSFACNAIGIAIVSQL